MQIIKDIEQGTEEWKELRLGKVTASRFSDVMAKGKGGAASKTRKSYMYQLAAEIITGEAQEFYSNQYMEWGNANEPQARSMYEFESNCDVEQVAFIIHSDNVGVSPDGLVGDDGLIEIKCPKTTTQIEYFLSGKVPAAYRTQIQGQMWVSGRDWCDFVSFDPRITGASGYFKVREYRDEEYIETLGEEVSKFVEELNDLLEKIK